MLRGYDPLKENFQWRAVISLLLGELLIISVALSSTLTSLNILVLQRHDGMVLLVPLMYIIVAIVFPPCNYLYARQERARRNTLRQGLLMSKHSLLAPLQPLAFSGASFPLYIQRKMKPLSLAGSVGLVFLICAAFGLDIFTFYASSWKFPPVLIMIMSVCGILIVAFPIPFIRTILGWITQYYLHPSLQVDEDGITARYRRDTIRMPWKDVRYFALVSDATVKSSLEGSREGKREAYEICDGENTICWIGATLREDKGQDDDNWLMEGLGRPRPNTAPSEWGRQVELLPSVIVAKAGLPLHDLRPSAQKRARQRKESHSIRGA